MEIVDIPFLCSQSQKKIFCQGFIYSILISSLTCGQFGNTFPNFQKYEDFKSYFTYFCGDYILNQCKITWYSLPDNKVLSKHFLSALILSMFSLKNDIELHCPKWQPLYTWLLSTWNVASMAEGLNFKFYLSLVFIQVATCGQQL